MESKSWDQLMKKTVTCEACQRPFEARTVRPKFGVFLCGSCEMKGARRVMKKYTNFQKQHITDSEREALDESKTLIR